MTTENKKIIERALADLVQTGGTAVLESVLADGFVHHRPDATTSTRQEWLAAVRAVPLDLRVELLHLLADGDHVVMHSRRSLPDDGPAIVGVDIWRLENGLVAEGWEILEPAAQAAANTRWWDPTPSR